MYYSPFVSGGGYEGFIFSHPPTSPSTVVALPLHRLHRKRQLGCNMGPQTIAKLVNLTPITVVYGTYNNKL